MTAPRWSRSGPAALALALAFGCALFHKEQGPPAATGPPPPLPVKKASEEVVVAAWAEPPRLPPAGGQVQILVRLQRRGGAPFEGVEVRLTAAGGALFSGGRVLVSDAGGQTRDRLTAHHTAFITLNAGGTVYRFKVPVGGREAPSR
ncbi:MAG: hypothetical protein DMF80_07390 [Acidobacteria bacterium]|nr:MAG: hypothetical protein DMF80_07390 [Acidobacteriota bacterium]